MSKTGNGRDESGDHGPQTPALDPIYDLPLIGRVIKEADAMRTRLPLGYKMAAGEAELLRAEARALRLAANYLETRARQLDRMTRRATDPERGARRVPVE